jgi:hypothetical protein
VKADGKHETSVDFQRTTRRYISRQEERSLYFDEIWCARSPLKDAEISVLFRFVHQKTSSI